MKVQVLFFGSTAAITGKRHLDLELPDATIAGHIFDHILGEYSSLTAHRLLFSLNQQFATGDEIICDGDELAIFTAVSGG